MDCSVKIVIYTKNSEQKKFLLAKTGNSWGFVRGVSDRREQPYTAGIRAVEAGTGIKHFKRYEYLGEVRHSGEKSWDDVFSMFVEKQETVPGNGYSEQEWFSYAEAFQKLSDHDKRILNSVNSKPA